MDKRVMVLGEEAVSKFNDELHGDIKDYESDPMYQAIYHASARAIIRYQQKIYLAEYVAKLKAQGLIVDDGRGDEKAGS